MLSLEGSQRAILSFSVTGDPKSKYCIGHDPSSLFNYIGRVELNLITYLNHLS